MLTAVSELGYKPRVSMKEAMQRTLKFFESERNPKAVGTTKKTQ